MDDPGWLLRCSRQVIGAAMLANLLLAAFSGLAVPITLRWLGIDPAIASSVLLTTITDVMGFRYSAPWRRAGLVGQVTGYNG